MFFVNIYLSVVFDFFHKWCFISYFVFHVLCYMFCVIYLNIFLCYMFFIIVYFPTYVFIIIIFINFIIFRFKMNCYMGPYYMMSAYVFNRKYKILFYNYTSQVWSFAIRGTLLLPAAYFPICASADMYYSCFDDLVP